MRSSTLSAMRIEPALYVKRQFTKIRTFYLMTDLLRVCGISSIACLLTGLRCQI